VRRGSGRNAGHRTPSFRVHVDPRDPQVARESFVSRLIERQTSAASLLFDIIRRYEIDCEEVQTGYVQVSNALGQQ
jgi:hypothetical protein